MRFAQRDLTEFGVYKAIPMNDGMGSCYNEYETAPSSFFEGNIQPFYESKSAEAYGIDMKYAYAIYCNPMEGLTELDRIGLVSEAKTLYEVKTIQRRHDYCRILVEEVRS